MEAQQQDPQEESTDCVDDTDLNHLKGAGGCKGSDVIHRIKHMDSEASVHFIETSGISAISIVNRFPRP
jgi:hypothetical protein